MTITQLMTSITIISIASAFKNENQNLRALESRHPVAYLSLHENEKQLDH